MQSNVETSCGHWWGRQERCQAILHKGAVQQPELKELVAHRVDRLTMTQGVL